MMKLAVSILFLCILHLTTAERFYKLDWPRKLEDWKTRSALDTAAKNGGDKFSALNLAQFSSEDRNYALELAATFGPLAVVQKFVRSDGDADVVSPLLPVSHFGRTRCWNCC